MIDSPIQKFHQNTLDPSVNPQLELFGNAEHYAWNWPCLDRLNRSMLLRDELFRESGLGDSLSEIQQEMFLQIYRTMYRQIARAICRPSPVYCGHSVRVEFLDCIAWVVEPGDRTTFLEVKNPGGNWRRTRRKFNLHDPLEDLAWLDQYMQRWAGLIDDSFGSYAYAVSWFLYGIFERQFHDRDLLNPTSRQVRHHMRVVPELLTVIGHINRWSPELGCDNGTYSTFWKDQQSWSNLSKHYRNLAQLYYLFRSKGQLEKGANLSGLRTLCFELGLKPAGWRFLCKHGEMAYIGIWSADEEQQPRLAEVIAYINWQAKARLDEPLDFDFGRALVRANCIDQDGWGDYRIELDPRLARAGQALARSEPPDDSEWWEWERLQEWGRVLEWFRDTRPAFDRNQWHRGWAVIWQRYSEWLKKKEPDLTWSPTLGSFQCQEWRVKELINSTELESESARMHHCAETYADCCAEGGYLMFTVENARSGLPMATIGFERSEAGWSLDQVQGKFNQDPGEQMRAVAGEIGSRLPG